MKRDVAEIRFNLDFVGCDNATAAEMCDEIERLLAALTEIVEHCANTGRGNEIVDARIVERVEETAIAALGGVTGPPDDYTHELRKAAFKLFS